MRGRDLAISYVLLKAYCVLPALDPPTLVLSDLFPQERHLGNTHCRSSKFRLDVGKSTVAIGARLIEGVLGIRGQQDCQKVFANGL